MFQLAPLDWDIYLEYENVLPALEIECPPCGCTKWIVPIKKNSIFRAWFDRGKGWIVMCHGIYNHMISACLNMDYSDYTWLYMTIGIFSCASKWLFWNFGPGDRFPAVFRPPGSAIDPWVRIKGTGFTSWFHQFFPLKKIKKNWTATASGEFWVRATLHRIKNCRMSFLPRWRSNQN